MSTKFNIADLFCGVGGLSLGFEKAGLKISVAIDNWEEALEIYNSNFNHKSIKLDLSDHVSTAEFLSENNINAIIGGPPCQDFSHAGKRNEGLRADLTASFAKVVATVKPLFFVMENVARTAKSKTYATARDIFKNSGYGLTEVILDASLCGVPQKRKRFFCIGILDADDNIVLSKINSMLSTKPMTMRDYFGKSLDTDFYYRHPRNYSRRAIYSLDEPSATIRGVNRPIPPNYPGHSADANDFRSARPLTTKERSQVQTFPENFEWIGSKTNIEQMIGNAVPVNLAMFVATAVKDILTDSETKNKSPNKKRYKNSFYEEEEFCSWLEMEKLLSRKASRDALSRLKRIMTYIDVFSPESNDMLIKHLELKFKENKVLPSVRPQLKKALLYFREFITR
jgi:DNA (cytosine-5)-methyltransferase 1